MMDHVNIIYLNFKFLNLNLFHTLPQRDHEKNHDQLIKLRNNVCNKYTIAAAKQVSFI